MKRYELGMSLEYVANWGIVDAVRELFQNCLDEETLDPENKMSFDYNEETGILRIGNRKGKLETRTLLLGTSTKRDDKSTIGQHGEGYKVATTVLLREGYGFKIYNYSNRELWTAKVVKSRRYGQDIGVFDVEKTKMKNDPNNSIVFEVSGVSKEDYESIKESNLWLQDIELTDQVTAEGYGRVLLDEKYSGKVFVRGLYVCTKSYMTYGFDLEPKLVDLDRDRGLVDSFNLQYSLGKLIVHTENSSLIKSIKGTWEGEYIRYFASDVRSKISEVYESALRDFYKKNGQDAVPCDNQDEFNLLHSKGYNAVLVNGNDMHFITHASGYTPVAEEITSTEELLDDWIERAKEYLPKDLYEEGVSLINSL